jgi:ribosomal protein S18 acetylase RimI-like enzyme
VNSEQEKLPETTTYLEMHSPSELIPVIKNKQNLDVRRINENTADLGKFLYNEIGEEWIWIDRLPWSREEWQQYYDQEKIQLWVGYCDEQIAGYFELENCNDGDVEITYFGLMSGFIGKGLGGLLLTAAIEKAWSFSATRVWLHTSSRDHANALNNYQARGLKIYKTETKLTAIKSL